MTDTLRRGPHVIESVDRLTNSKSGNPRWRVYFAGGGKTVTAPDSQCAFGIEEYVGQEVALQTDQYGRLTHIGRTL